MRFDFIDLTLFLFTAETGSITAGAEKANLALSSASARIKGMEEMLGIPLLLRGARGIEVTAAGKALMHHARIALRQQELMRSELSEYAQGLIGHIRIMSNTVSLTEFLPEALSSFLASHPNVNIELEERRSFEIVSALAERTIDIGILANSVDVSSFDAFPFQQDKLSLVVPLDHPLSAKKEIYFAQTLDFSFVGLQKGSALQDFLAEQAAQAGKRFRYRVRLSSFEAVCRTISHNVGIGVVPQVVADRLSKTMDIRTVQILDSWSTRKLLICTPSYAELPLHSQQLITQIRTS